MRKRPFFSSSISGSLLSAALTLCLMFAGPASGQSEAAPGSLRRTTAVGQDQSRAELQAERMVSLSAERIITLLDKEPGLLLEVKKMLVRTAYEQGRVLDPEELTDEALYRLIGRDQNVRVLITREIEDREYVRAKPTREELARQRQFAPVVSSIATPTKDGTEQTSGAESSQEDLYWSERDKVLQNYAAPAGPAPSQAPAPQPQAPPLDNSQRAVGLAQLQNPMGDFSGVGDYGTIMPTDMMGMQQISPDQLPALLAARMGSGSNSGQGEDSGSSGTGGSWPALGSDRSTGTSSLMNPLLNPSMSGSSTDLQSYSLPQLQAQDQSLASLYAPRTSLNPPRRPNYPSFARLTQPVLTRRPNPYADVPSLYDLYAQYSRRSPVLARFGLDVFRNGTGNLDELPMDMPVGPDYVLGPGDSLNINLWGGISQRLVRMVDREGRIALPEVGGVQVAGRTMGDVQHMVQTALRTQFRDVEADVSISRLRTIRVYVVGDVEHPGAYDVSSLSTPLNALFEAGGPTSEGSLRILNHYREKQLLQQVDVYDLLLHGIRSSVQRLENGDTVQVPPLGAEVTIEGMVRRPAIYELDGEKNLAQVLELAGGVLPSGTLRHIDVERLQAHQSRTMLALDIPDVNNQGSVTKSLEDFTIQDGDKIKISPIVSFADKTVYLDGHVFRPGKYAYREGMKVTDLITSYKDLLPEPYKAHAEVIRLEAPDYTPEVLAFNLADAMAGKEQDLALKPFDTVRIFGKYDFEDPPLVTVSGEVRDPGDHVTNGVTYLRDAIYLAGNTTPNADMDDVQIFRHTQDGKLQVLSVDLRRALDGEASDNILLQPKDRVFVHRDLAKTDPAVVTIEGEVGRPGKYPLGENMSAADLVRLSGGLKRGAYTQEADLTRYEIAQGSKVVSDHVNVPIAAALAGQPDADVRLRDGDVLTIRQLAGWKDLGAVITIGGEVEHPGTYGIQEGERLSSVIQRAGGLRSDAYPFGAIFERVQVRELEEENRADLVRRVKGEEAEVRLTPGGDQDDVKQATVLQYETTLEKLQHTPPAGRLVIHISSDIRRWMNTPADVQVRDGDSLYIPKKPNIVIVDGSVYNPTAITYKPGRNAGWYLRQAGGPTDLANKKAIFVVRADGSVAGGPAGLFSGGVESAALQPGDMVVVPEKTFSISKKFQNTVQAAQIATALGIAIEAARTF